MMLALSTLESPVGTLVFAVGADGLRALDFAESKAAVLDRLQRDYPGASVEELSLGRRELRLAEAPTGTGTPRLAARAVSVASKLRAYFDGQLGALEDIEVAPTGTPFQKRVWAALRKVGPGQTASYRELASAIGRRSAVRAVGMANARNPIALVVPCHRIIASDGSLAGYAGGVRRKEWLLRHERALPS
jgi:methylated-DNA-[protein]-cysteine S-methyltransferase